MTRVTSFAAWLCLCGLLLPLDAQQTPVTPPPPQAASDPLPPPPADVPQPPVPASPATDAPPLAPNDPLPSLPTAPSAALPLTPAEQRERDIDKFDPSKPLLVPGQQTPSQTDRKAPAPTTRRGSQNDPLPGSVAASNAATNAANAQASQSRASAAAQVTADDASDGAVPAGTEYTGPAVLSRSYTLARPMIPRQIKWESTFGLSYSWSEGQAPSAVKGVTSYQSTSAQSLSYRWGVAGRHLWRHDQIGLSYSGNYSGYGSNGLSGINNSLNLDYGHVISRRISFQVSESVQDLSQNYSLENPTLAPGNSIANINLATSPSVQLLNSTTRQSSTTASLTFHQTSRLSYNMSGSYFVVGRTEGVGVFGRQAGGDINYRWTKRTTVGTYYSFTNYIYPHNISNSDSHSIGAIFSYAFDSRTQLQTRIGITRIESLAYETVPLPPALAAILGQTSTIINAYSLRRTSDISIQLVRDFRRTRTASLAYAHGQSPGNGVLLTSVQQTITAGGSAAFLSRRLPLSGGVTYTTLESASQGQIAFYRSESAYLGSSRRLRLGVDATLSFTYSRYHVAGTPLLEHTMALSLGLSWSPPHSLLPF